MNYPEVVYKYRSWSDAFYKNILLKNELYLCPSPSPYLNPSHSLYFCYPWIISCFPQMKPESSAQTPVPSVQEPELSTQKEYELSEDEEAVLNILKDNSPIDLNALKGQSGLSNKKWDKAIKGLTKNKLASVEKTDAGLFVSLT